MSSTLNIASIEYAREQDRLDNLHAFRSEFHIPEINGQQSVYLCGNSLGLQPRKAKEYVLEELEDWAKLGVEGHMQGRHPWLPYHEFLAQPMARVVGAAASEVVVMNSLTVNVHLLFVSFYRPVGKRRKVIIESDAFPSDLYAVQSQIKFHGGDPESDLLMWKPREGEHTVRYADLDEIMEAHGDEVALVFIGGVNYYTGQSFDLKRISALAHEHGALAGFDLAHGAGNIPYQLHESGADFACWCSYKYLNSGPGSLSGIFVHDRHARAFDLPRFAGWWGHNKDTRFGMRDPFDPLPGAEGWQLSNPPILPMAAMRASLELFETAGMPQLRQKSIKLTNYLHELLADQDIAEHITVITPAESHHRGCQLSLFVHKGGKEVFDNITRAGVIADWREPNVIRIAPVPLYNTFEDVWQFVQLLKSAIAEH